MKMKVIGEPHSTSAILASEVVVPADLKAFRRATAVNKRRVRNGSLTRERRSGAPVGRRSRPETPLLKWNLGDRGRGRNGDVEDEDRGGGDDRGERELTRSRGSKKTGTTVSARKLAAGLWRLQVSDAVAAAGERSRKDPLGFQGGAGYVNVQSLHHRSGTLYGYERNSSQQSPISVSATKKGHYCKIEPTTPFSHTALEGATKWDPIGLAKMDEVHQIYSHMKQVDQQVNALSLVTSLEAEVEEARARIKELETGKQSQKKKLEQFLRKVSEEKAAWRSREHGKIRAFIDDMKADLNREMKSRQRLEIVNSKLVRELSDAKLAAKRYIQDYEKERKAREMIEEVCDELAEELGEDKAEVEALKRESIKLREEADDERKMLQMAEVWREERVQMKLIDAKVALEEKYSQMNKLVADLEAFLRSVNATTTDAKEIKEAELLRQAATAVNINNVKEFTYDPPAQDDIFSVFEDVNFGGANGRETGPCVADSPASHASKVHTVSPEAKIINKDRHSKIFIDRNCDNEKDESQWETVSHLEEQGSSYSPDGSIPSVNKNNFISKVSMSGTECDETPKSEISELCSDQRRQSKRASSSITKLWKSISSKEQNYKIMSMVGMNGTRVSNGRKSNVSVLSHDGGSCQDGFSQSDVAAQWSSPDSNDSHMIRGTRGRIERPRVPQKDSFKAKLLEAKMESKKVQIRHVLNQKY